MNRSSTYARVAAAIVLLLAAAGGALTNTAATHHPQQPPEVPHGEPPRDASRTPNPLALAPTLGTVVPVDRAEAKAAAEQVIQALRSEQYEGLLPLLDESRWSTHVGPSGAQYEIQVFALWDDVADGHLRVVASAGQVPRWRLAWMKPESADFIIGPESRFVGEPASKR